MSTSRQRPSTIVPDPTADTLAPYFAALQHTALLSADEELALASEIDRLVVEHWRVLLSYDGARPHVALAVAECLQSPPLTPARGAALTRLARRLRRLDASGAALRRARAAVEAAFAADPKAASYLRRVARAHLAERSVKQRFVTANLRLVITMARRHGHSMLSLADLVQEGNFGLMRAVEGFDHRRGHRFSTYATWWIRQAIRRSLADKGRLVRVPVHALEDISRIKRAKDSIAAIAGTVPDVTELAGQTGLPVSKLAMLSTPGLLGNPISLDGTFQDEDGRTLHDTLASDGERAPDEVVDLENWHRQLERLFEQLTPIEVAILRLRYGLDGQELSLREIGEQYRLSRERIRQIQVQALAKLRQALASDSPSDDREDGLAA